MLGSRLSIGGPASRKPQVYHGLDTNYALFHFKKFKGFIAGHSLLWKCQSWDLKGARPKRTV